MKTLTVGTDVSKESLDVAVRVSDAEKREDLGKFENKEKGFRKLAKAVEKKARKEGVEQIVLILEPTGGYEYPLALFAKEQGWEIFMPNPYRVRKWAESEGIRAKTDKVDARMLTDYGIEKYKKLHQWKPLPEEIAKLNEMLKRMDNIEESIRQEENRLGAMDFRGLVAKGAIASIERTISFLKQELKRLEEDIDKLLDENPEFREQAKRLRTVPGIGKKNCLPFLVLMHRWKI